MTLRYLEHFASLLVGTCIRVIQKICSFMWNLENISRIISEFSWITDWLPFVNIDLVFLIWVLFWSHVLQDRRSKIVKMIKIIDTNIDVHTSTRVFIFVFRKGLYDFIRRGGGTVSKPIHCCFVFWLTKGFLGNSYHTLFLETFF